MVKYFEVRDMNGAAITSLLAEGSSMLAKIRSDFRGFRLDFAPISLRFRLLKGFEGMEKGSKKVSRGVC